MINYIKNNQGSAILTTLFILFGILALSMIGIDIMISGFKAQAQKGASGIAYYAAESGIERTLMLYKLDNNFFHDKNCNAKYIDFGTLSDTDMDVGVASCSAIKKSYNFSDGSGVIFKSTPPTYKVEVSLIDRDVTLKSQAQYLNTNRAIEVTFCVPDCVNPKNISGVNYDWCGGICQ